MHQCLFRSTSRAAPPPKALTRNRPLTIVPRRELWSPVCGSLEGSELDRSSSGPVGEEAVADAEGDKADSVGATEPDCAGTTTGAVDTDLVGEEVPVLVPVDTAEDVTVGVSPALVAVEEVELGCDVVAE